MVVHGKLEDHHISIGVREASHPGMSRGSATVKIFLSGSVRLTGHMWDVKFQASHPGVSRGTATVKIFLSRTIMAAVRRCLVSPRLPWIIRKQLPAMSAQTYENHRF